MAQIELNQVHFTYPTETTAALSDVSLTIEQGEFIVLCGPSGCGKTSLLRLLKKEIRPTGSLQGEVRFEGRLLDDMSPIDSIRAIGMVFQDPENQIVMDDVWQELVFGLENLRYPTSVMRKKVAELVHFFGLENILQRKTHELSGGQKQILNLASILLLQPRVILLDEPTAQLDPIAAREFLQLVTQLNQEFGMTIVMVEHRLEDTFPLADRIILMSKGRIVNQGKPKEVAQKIWKAQDPTFLPYLPAISQLYLECIPSGQTSAIPLTVKEGRQWLQSQTDLPIMAEKGKIKAVKVHVSPLFEAKNIQFQYEKQGPTVLNRLSLQIHKGDFLAILGGNGAGKSTLLQALAGLLIPQKGKILYAGQKVQSIKPDIRYKEIGYLAQNPLLYFIHDTISEDLLHVATRLGIKDSEKEIERLLQRLGIVSLLSKHPHDISGGERQKAALAGILLAKPNVLLIDEPTKGLDPVSKEELGQLLGELNEQGITIVMVTHDLEFAARYTNRCALLFEGEFTSDGVPHEFFQDNYFYTTTISRMTRGLIPNAITREEVLTEWERYESSPLHRSDAVLFS
jgi:energy-coupling factor transport system ATP-binding protein